MKNIEQFIVHPGVTSVDEDFVVDRHPRGSGYHHIVPVHIRADNTFSLFINCTSSRGYSNSFKRPGTVVYADSKNPKAKVKLRETLDCLDGDLFVRDSTRQYFTAKVRVDRRHNGAYHLKVLTSTA